MTPADRARAVVERLFERMQFRNVAVYSEGWAEEIIATALREERAAVWQEAAEVAEACWHGPGDHGCAHGREIAAELRARGEAAMNRCPQCRKTKPHTHCCAKCSGHPR